MVWTWVQTLDYLTLAWSKVKLKVLISEASIESLLRHSSAILIVILRNFQKNFQVRALKVRRFIFADETDIGSVEIAWPSCYFSGDFIRGYFLKSDKLLLFSI